MREERWVNWDTESGDDFWNVVEEVDDRRVGEEKERKQMDEIRRIHEVRMMKRGSAPRTPVALEEAFDLAKGA